jgi:hypothetical protein
MEPIRLVSRRRRPGPWRLGLIASLLASGLTCSVPLVAFGSGINKGGVARAAILTPIATPSTSTVSSPICGTWALVTVRTAGALKFFKTLINESLTVPKVAGFSIRAPWTSIVSDLSIYGSALQIAQSYKVKLAIRFVSGVNTPPQYLGNSVLYVASGQQIPLPWGSGSTPTSFLPNSKFESGYAATVKQLAAWARAHGVHELHLTGYSGPNEEIYLGPEIVAAAGYSTQNFLSGYERLIDIGMSVAGPDLTVEFTLSGKNLSTVLKPLEHYITGKYGTYPPALIAQWDNLTATTPARSGDGLNIGRQMFDKGDYDWAAVYETLVDEHSKTVEVYLQSFAPSNPNVKLLHQEIAAFAGVC